MNISVHTWVEQLSLENWLPLKTKTVPHKSKKYNIARSDDIKFMRVNTKFLGLLFISVIAIGN
jgi:hypothetical protein